DAFAIMRPPSFFLSLLRLRVFASWRWSPRQNSELAGDVAKSLMSQTENRETRQTRERECRRSRLSRGSRCPSGIHEQRETTPRRQDAERRRSGGATRPWYSNSPIPFAPSRLGVLA